ncbi:MAG: MBL fold metallo-hydrolase [bacterium]
MVELVVLGSGSKGNSTLIRTANTALLVDAGLSARQLGLRLQDAGLDPARLDGVLLTHEHGDHVRGLRVLNRRFPTPVLGNSATLAAAGPAIGAAPEKLGFITGMPITMGDFGITSFHVSHDAAEPVGYVLEAEGIRIGYATDLGRITPDIVRIVQGCHVVVLEANHDVEMLWKGPYPWPTKERIRSEVGHLDNESGAAEVGALTRGETAHLVLIHLSENNNEPDLVRETYAGALERSGRDGVELTITGQREIAPSIRF